MERRSERVNEGCTGDVTATSVIEKWRRHCTCNVANDVAFLGRLIP